MNLIKCFMTESDWYKSAGTGKPVGVLWHDTSAGEPALKRYVQPSTNDANYANLIASIGTNDYGNHWNQHFEDPEKQKGVNAFIGELKDGSVGVVQVGPWNKIPWGVGYPKGGNPNHSLNYIDGKLWIQFEICDDFKGNNPRRLGTYFKDAIEAACELTAYLCDMYGIDPYGTVTLSTGDVIPTILCHQDAYQLGYGSDHGDTLKWFELFGIDGEEGKTTFSDIKARVATLLGSGPYDIQFHESICEKCSHYSRGQCSIKPWLCPKRENYNYTVTSIADRFNELKNTYSGLGITQDMINYVQAVRNRFMSMIHEKKITSNALFIGDSLTVGLKTYGNLNQTFYCHTGASIDALGGTELKQFINGTHFDRVFILAGINSLTVVDTPEVLRHGKVRSTAQEIARKVIGLVNYLRDSCGLYDSHIVIQSVLYLNNTSKYFTNFNEASGYGKSVYDLNRYAIVPFNEVLEDYCNKNPNMEYLNLNLTTALANIEYESDGDEYLSLNSMYASTDGLHLNDVGYKRWAEILRDRYFTATLTNDVFEDTETSSSMKYYLYTPASVTANTKLLVFLHGYGEHGDNIDKVLNVNLPKHIKSGKIVPNCYVLIPQCADGEWWKGTNPQLTENLIKYIKNKYSQISSVVLSGFSYGARGVWCLAARTKVSGISYQKIAPISNGMSGINFTPAEVRSKLENVPIWFIAEGSISSWYGVSTVFDGNKNTLSRCTLRSDWNHIITNEKAFLEDYAGQGKLLDWLLSEI